MLNLVVEHEHEHETAEKKLQLGSLYIALQQMRRAAKLNLSAIDRILNIMKDNPSMAFLKKIIKPMCEMVLRRSSECCCKYDSCTKECSSWYNEIQCSRSSS